MESIQSSSCAVELKCKADKSKWHVKCFPKNSKSGVKRSEIIARFFHTFPPGLSRAHHPSGLMCPVVSSLAGGRTGGTASGGGFLQPRREPQSLYDSCLRAQLLKERLFAPITHVVPSYYSEVWASSEL